MMIGLSSEAGEVEEAEAELLHRVFTFGDRHVHEVMVPRTEAVMLDRNATIADFYATYVRSPHSRFPVFDESPDKVVGVLGIKDVLSALSSGEVTAISPVEPLMRSSLFVPETKLIGELFREMQATGNQMAIAVSTSSVAPRVSSRWSSSWRRWSARYTTSWRRVRTRSR